MGPAGLARRRERGAGGRRLRPGGRGVLAFGPLGGVLAGGWWERVVGVVPEWRGAVR